VQDQSAPSYPIMRALVRAKAVVPGASAAVIFLFFAYAAWRWSEPSFAVLSVVFGYGAFIGCRLQIELVELLSDMLLPR
jgi:hypothetical protein